MSLRDEILQGLVVENGKILSPGKFQGEMAYVAYYWGRYLDGWADEEDDRGGVIFYVTRDDRILFPELGKLIVIRLVEDEQGFVKETLTVF